MRKFKDAVTVAGELSPDNPLHLYRPRATDRAVSFFLKHFAGTVMYAVKTNPERHILTQLYDQGVRAFDVASLEEIKTTHNLFPDARLHFMHTVKSRKAIKLAYFDYGIRDFALDCTEELQKIVAETNQAKDLNLYVRLAVPNTYAELNLADKFGARLSDAVKLLKEARKYALKLGICFHVGSQCMHPDAYRIAIRMAHKVADKAGVKVNMLDVGGGFPSIYPGMVPPAMNLYFDAIKEEFEKMPKENGCELLCEPGRALVAESGSVLVRVELRKGEHLYINDGTYGSLFDAGVPHFIFPVKLIRTAGEHSMNAAPFSFFGPTCDTLDFMKGPFYLPEDVREGDYIEIGQLGAYGRTLVTNFNGFIPESEIVALDDDPLMTLYDGKDMAHEPPEIIAA